MNKAILQIKLASDSDFSGIMDLIKQVISAMAQNGIFQWNEAYPNSDVVSKDIKERELFVLKIGEFVDGIVTLNDGKSIEFGKSCVPELQKKELILHRLAVRPGYQRIRVGRSIAGFFGSLRKVSGL